MDEIVLLELCSDAPKLLQCPATKFIHFDHFCQVFSISNISLHHYKLTAFCPSVKRIRQFKLMNALTIFDHTIKVSWVQTHKRP